MTHARPHSDFAPVIRTPPASRSCTSSAAFTPVWRWANRQLNGGALRIVMYHGVCRDEDREQAWVPSHYVSVSALDHQLNTMKHAGTVIDLRELPAFAAQRRWRTPLFAVTFDDAPANLFSLAAPVLASHNVSATIFACTDRLMDGAVLEHDMRQAQYGPAGRSATAASAGLYFCAEPSSATLPTLSSGTKKPINKGIFEESPISEHVRESLRCMRWDEAIAMRDAGHWIGAHTRSHVRLSRLSELRRREEIVGSIQTLREKFNTLDIPFAYPWGQRCDFLPEDELLLRELDVPLVCTGITGDNRLPIDRFRLRRNCIGLYHTPARFAITMLGLLDQRHRKRAEVATCP